MNPVIRASFKIASDCLSQNLSRIRAHRDLDQRRSVYGVELAAEPRHPLRPPPAMMSGLSAKIRLALWQLDCKPSTPVLRHQLISLRVSRCFLGSAKFLTSLRRVSFVSMNGTSPKLTRHQSTRH